MSIQLGSELLLLYSQGGQGVTHNNTHFHSLPRSTGSVHTGLQKKTLPHIGNTLPRGLEETFDLQSMGWERRKYLSHYFLLNTD